MTEREAFLDGLAAKSGSRGTSFKITRWCQ